MNKSAKGVTAVICLSPYSGGMEMDAIKLAKLLVSELQVVLVAKAGCYIAKYYPSTLEDSGICLETIEFSSKFSLSIISRTRKIINQYHIQNVIFFGASELRSLYFAFLGYNLTVLVRHGTTKTSSKKDWLHKLIYSCVDYHVAICEHLAKNVQSIIPFGKKTQLKVIYPSLREEPVLSRHSASKPVTLLHMGRITEGKGQKEAIEACEVLYSHGIEFQLVCVGDMDPDYEKEFTAYLENKPYAGSVQLKGFAQDVAGYYQRADIFIFPSKGEGLSNAFIEALSYGLICIAFSNTSFPELRGLGFDFLMAKDQDIGDLKQKLLQSIEFLHANEMPLQKQSQLAVELFSAKRELNEYLSLLQ